MKTITEMFYGYDALLATFEHDVLIKVDQNDYQGDSWVLFQDGGRIGYLVFGWGSCSGCDALEACESVTELAELQTRLYDSIHWEESAAAMLAYFQNKDFETEFYGRCEEFQDFLTQAKARLAA